MPLRIDINADLGESYGAYRMGNDAALFPHLTSCNIACGAHGGDAEHIDNAIQEAIKYAIRIGAHPGYPDLAGFGRRQLDLSDAALQATIKYQVAALDGLCRSHGARLQYVKPHGALYHAMAEDERIAELVIKAILSINPALAIMGPANSCSEQVCTARAVPFLAEAFADRRYTATGGLVSRQKAHAVITDAEEAAAQVLDIVLRQRVRTEAGTYVPVRAQSICVHGDNEAAPLLLAEIDRQLAAHQIEKTAFL